MKGIALHHSAVASILPALYVLKGGTGSLGFRVIKETELFSCRFLEYYDFKYQIFAHIFLYGRTSFCALLGAGRHCWCIMH